MGARQVRACAAGGPDRGRRRNPAPTPRANEPRLSRGPQTDRAVFLRRQPARQGAGRDVAAIRSAVPRLFHERDHTRIAGRAGAGREFRQSGGAHLLALAMEPQPFRDLPARLQRRRPFPDDRCSLRRGRAVLYPGERGRGYRMRVHQPHYPRDPEPCHRAHVRVSGSQRRGGSRARGRCEGRPAAETGSCRLYPSLRRGPPRLSHAATFG